MQTRDKQVELYEDRGRVMRRVTRDLGNGVRVITSDVQFHPDIHEFVQANPRVKIRGYHPQTDVAVESPERHTLQQLPAFLAGIDSVDVLLRLRRLDSRKMAVGLYEERLQQILDAEFGDDEGDDEAE